MVARQTSNLEAVGSSPTRNANFKFCIMNIIKLLNFAFLIMNIVKLLNFAFCVMNIIKLLRKIMFMLNFRNFLTAGEERILAMTLTTCLWNSNDRSTWYKPIFLASYYV